jgi:hypothetical protein
MKIPSPKDEGEPLALPRLRIEAGLKLVSNVCEGPSSERPALVALVLA